MVCLGGQVLSAILDNGRAEQLSLAWTKHHQQLQAEERPPPLDLAHDTQSQWNA